MVDVVGKMQMFAILFSCWQKLVNLKFSLVKMTYVSALFESFWELGMASIGLRQATNKDGYIKEVDKWKAKWKKGRLMMARNQQQVDILPEVFLPTPNQQIYTRYI